jgi:predicted TIM-barrel fold metal-dependent hydrolase
MTRIVAIEEHYATPDLLAATGLDLSWLPDNPHDRLLETAEGRLADMDAAGIDVQVLSAVGPAVQELPDDVAIPLARDLNTRLHDSVIAGHPDRFAAFATLPTGNVAAAVDELERSVTRLGFVGALINGTTGDRFLDHPDFAPLLSAAAALDVPVYLHPGVPPKPVMAAYYAGVHPPLGRMLATAGYGWHYETSLHALRLVVAGVFDRLPGLRIILGHLGEGIPFHLQRIEDMLTPLADHLAQPVSSYFRQNFWVTTSGYFFDGPLALTREVFGDDRVLFSVDYPYSDNKRAADWLRDLPVEQDVRDRIAHGNADRLLGL